jgi:Xaa-Pro aminopeptidase
MTNGLLPPFDGGRLSVLMEKYEVDLLLASTRHNTRYLTGGYYYPLYMWDAHGRRTQYVSFLGIPRGGLGDSFFVGRPGEAEVMREADVWITQCYEGEKIASLSIAARAVEILKQRGLDSARIAVELPSLPADVFGVLEQRLPDAEFVDAVPIMDGLRAVKRPDEIERIREGTRKNQEALSAVLTSGWDGATTAEITDRVATAFRERGLHFLYALVCAGPSFFRAPSVKRKWKRGRILHIDAGGMSDGYIVELCRTGCLGEPPGPADDLLQGCRDLERAVLEVLRPGVPAASVQGTADAFLADYPLGKNGKFIAHGIGLVHHEDPVIDTNSDHPLEQGNVLSIEMEFKTPEVGHVKIEDMVLITGRGNEVLSPGEEDWYISNP